MTQEEQNLFSRLETLDALYSTFRAELQNLNPDEAITLSTPIADKLLRAVGYLREYREEKQVDGLIGKALSQSEDEI